jgi:hypothetical protein
VKRADDGVPPEATLETKLKHHKRETTSNNDITWPRPLGVKLFNMMDIVEHEEGKAENTAPPTKAIDLQSKNNEHPKGKSTHEIH